MISEFQIKPTNYFTIILLVIIGFFIKGFNIGEMGIGGDECFSVYASQLSPLTIITWLSTGDNPPLWELLLHYWVKLFGVSEISIRFPSLIFNSLTIIPIYLIGEKFIRKNSGSIAASLYILSSFSLFLAQEARVYSLLGFLATYSVYLFLSAIANNEKKNTLIFLTLINGLILYSHYLGYWIILVQIIIFCSFSKVRKHLKWKYIYHLLTLFILFIPLIPVLFSRFSDSGMNGTWITKTSSISELYNMLWKFSNQPVTTVVFIIIITLALVKFTIHQKEKSIQISYAIFINFFVWIPLILSFVISFKVGFFLDRYFYFLSPFFYLSTVISVDFLLSKYTLYYKIINITLVLLMLFTFKISTKGNRTSGYHQNTKLIAQEILKNVNKKTTAIILSPEWYDKEIVYYLDRSLFTSHFSSYNKSSAFKEPLNEKGIYPTNHYSQIAIEPNITDILYVDRDANFHSNENGISHYLKTNYIYLNQYKIENIMFTEYSTR